MTTATAIFFDLGNTLVVPEFDSAGALVRFEVFPFVLEVLDRLRGATAGAPHAPKLGVMSNTPVDATDASMRALLADAGLLPRLDASLLVFSSVEGISKADPKFFRRGATRAGIPASRCIFVGEDANERAIAQQAGFRVSFHPLHAFHELRQLH